MHKDGVDARQMAAMPIKPVVAAAAAPAKAANRFAEWFGSATFKAEPIRKPYEYKNGADTVETLQYGKASVLFERFPGVHFTASRIVLRVSPGPADKEGNSKGTGQKVLSLVMPTISAGKGAPRYPIINVKEADEATQREYLDFQSGVLGEYVAWRKSQVAAGHTDRTSSVMPSNAMEISGEDLASLGL